jgi:regulator of protease activity HflC (stomatin/prohibitin superfamily)
MKLENNTLNRLLVKIGGGVLLLGVVIFFISNMVTTVHSDEIVVKQNFLDGHLQVWSEAGVKCECFGHLTHYKKSAQYWFSAKEDEGKKTDDSIKVRFNDGGHGQVSGSLRYNLPTDPRKMVLLHSTYGSMQAIDHELVRQVVNKSVYMTGPLMSSRESYAERRNDLITYITDQVVGGVYRTEHKPIKTIDPISGQEKTIDFVQPKPNDRAPNGIEREEESPIQKYGMDASNITVNNIEYDSTVESQIKQQQEAIMAVQAAIVNSKKAEQDALTVAKQGEAEAAKAKWAQEVIKATEITKAQQDKEVATLVATKNKEVAALSLETAKLTAQETLTAAKAESDAKKMAIQADNALQTRLDAYVDVQKAWAASYGSQRQVPEIQMGASNSVSGNSGPTWVDMMMIKTAKDLGVSSKP